MMTATDPGSPGPERSVPRGTGYSERARWGFLSVLFLSGITAYIDRGVVSIILEPLRKEFGASDTMLGLLTGFSFAVCYATLSIPISRWADRGDRPLIISASILAYSICTLLCGFVSAFWQLVLLRIGVGAGEAGGVPCAQSLIGDYYPPERRARANGVYVTCGIVASVLVLVGGTRIAQDFGWRRLLICAGAPGILIAGLSGFCLAEPRRLFGYPAKIDRERMGAAMHALLRKRSYVHVVGALVCYYLLAFGALSFQVSFIVRVHHATLSHAGKLLAIVGSISAIVGSLAGGIMADFLAAKDVAWLGRWPAIGLIVCCPLFLLAFAAPSELSMALVLTCGYIVLWASYPAILGAIHAVCGNRRRATAFAAAFLLANLIGLGLGPLLTGSLSDGLAKSLGPIEGLRVAMLVMMMVFIPAGIHLFLATKWMPGDVEP